MDMLPVKPERMAQLEAYALLHDQSLAEALDELLAGSLNEQRERADKDIAREQLMERLSGFGKRHQLTLGPSGVKELLDASRA